jgi:hypothetical protein
VLLAYLSLDRFDEAERSLQQAAARFPGRPWWDGDWGQLRWRARRYPEAISGLEAAAAALPAPVTRLIHVRVLAEAGQRDEARRLVTELAARESGCEARAVLAGLTLDAGDRAAASQMVESILNDAAGPTAPPGLYRCAATASAALGDARAAAAWLSRIANDAHALRVWTLEAPTTSAAKALRYRWYPWSKVADAEPMRTAERDLQQAYDRLREEIASGLGGLK